MAETAERFEIRGLVQGVFYRKWAQANAEGLGLRGWVRNRPDGSVEALFAGPKDRLDAFAQAALAGPPDARVEKVERFAAEAPDGEDVVIADDG